MNNLPVGADEGLSRLYYNVILKTWVKHIYEKATGRIKRIVRFVKIIATYRTDYLNPKRPGHRLQVELTASQTVPIDQQETATEKLLDTLGERYREKCIKWELPDLRLKPETETEVKVDYEEAASEEPYTEEPVDWHH
ncbi:MAG: hypothetical protein QMD13_09410 [Candidatus Bathyarchaeia archaeon]|nr:hypothetical protein [Candidatus Bathyarchaeia archaeon]